MAEKGFLTVLICIFSFCGQPFEIVSSTSQEYIAGRKESGGGIKFKIELVALKSSRKLSFDNLYVDGKELKLKIQNREKKFITAFSKGDTLLLSSTLILSTDELQEMPSKVPEEVILNYHFKKNESVAFIEPKRLESNNYK